MVTTVDRQLLAGVLYADEVPPEEQTPVPAARGIVLHLQFAAEGDESSPMIHVLAATVDKEEEGFQPDIVMRVAMPDLLRYLLADNQRGLAPAGHGNTGEVEQMRHLREAVARFDPDVEEFLAGYVGDLAAHRLSFFTRKEWWQERRHRFSDKLRDCLVEQGRLVPDDKELQRFARDIDHLYDRSEHLLARLQSLRIKPDERFERFALLVAVVIYRARVCALRLDDLVLGLPALRGFRLLYFSMPGYWLGRRYWQGKSRGERLRSLLVDLGPLYVKVGQLLSTRCDLFPEDIIRELSLLCDQVPPFPGAQARAIVEASLNKPWSEVYADFDETALASASVAQVHTARLVDGRNVIVKVIRPGIRRQINDDIGYMRALAVGLEKYVAGAKKLKPSNVVNEFHKTLLNEMDMLREAANASQLRRNFADDDHLYIPYVIWEWTSSSVLVMERIEGIPVDERQRLQRRATIYSRWHGSV